MSYRAAPRLTVTAVLACHNRKAKTLACLKSLLEQDATVDVRVVVFDDGSADGTATAVRRLCPAAEILVGDGRAFWAGGMRAAFAAALAEPRDYYLWLNDDVRLAPHALRTLLETAEAKAAEGRPICLVGGAVADPRSGQTSYAGIVRPWCGRPLRFNIEHPHPTRPRRCDTLVGNVVLVPRATAARVGNIDPVFRHTLGDLDYGLRVAAAGGWVGLAPGQLGTCLRETASGRWFDPALPVGQRWRLASHPLGFPLRPWLRFARRHGGPAWLAFAPLPYWRLFAPLWLARRIDRQRVSAINSAPRHA